MAYQEKEATETGRDSPIGPLPNSKDEEQPPTQFKSITKRMLSQPNTPQNLSRTTTRASHQSRYHGGDDGYSVFNNDELDDSGEPCEGEHDEPDEIVAYEVNWEGGDSDPMSPRSFGHVRKWIIVLVLSASSLCVTCTSSLYTSTYNQTTEELHISRVVATLGLSLFIFGLGIGPMFLAPLSEFYGRRIVYIISYAFFIIWLIPCALANNVGTLLVGRFLDGVAGSAFLSVAGGTVGDMFAKKDLSMPMMAYTASPLVGPELGPLIGGFINQYANWRWSFWTLMLWSGVQLVAIVLLVPETYSPVLLKRKAQALRKRTGNQRYKAKIELIDKSILKTVALSCKRPFELLFFEPMCFNLCLMSAILLGIIYLFFGAFPLVFGKNHGFELHQVGLSFLGMFSGMLLGIVLNTVLWSRQYDNLVKKEGVSEPEFRLPPTIAGAILVPIGLFGFAWTTYPWVHWIVPIIFSGIFGLGTIWCFSGIYTFLVECYPLYAASALAANSFARSSFGAAFPLFGVQMYNKLGYQWATSLLAFLALAMAPFPYIFFVYGKRLRGNSRFASS